MTLDEFFQQYRQQQQAPWYAAQPTPVQWQKSNVWDGDSGSRDVWTNPQTGEQRYQDPNFYDAEGNLLNQNQSGYGNPLGPIPPDVSRGTDFWNQAKDAGVHNNWFDAAKQILSSNQGIGDLGGAMNAGYFDQFPEYTQGFKGQPGGIWNTGDSSYSSPADYLGRSVEGWQSGISDAQHVRDQLGMLPIVAGVAGSFASPALMAAGMGSMGTGAILGGAYAGLQSGITGDDENAPENILKGAGTGAITGGIGEYLGSGNPQTPPMDMSQIPDPQVGGPVQSPYIGTSGVDVGNINPSQMPSAQPPIDPTFGGQLTQTGQGQFENIGNINSFGNNLQPPTGTGFPGSPPGSNINNPGISTNLDTDTLLKTAGAGAVTNALLEDDDNDPTNPYQGDTNWGDSDNTNDDFSGGGNNGINDDDDDFWNDFINNPDNASMFNTGGLFDGLGGLFNDRTLGAGISMLQYKAMKDYQSGLLDTMNRAVDRSDPFYAQRPFYQDQFKNMSTNPNWMDNDSVLQGMQNNAMRNVASQNAAKGYLNSGNMLHDLTRTGVETAGNYAMPRMEMAGRAAGAFQGPGQAGQVMSNLGNLAGQAGVAAQGAIGSGLGSLFGNRNSGGSGGSDQNRFNLFGLT